MAVIAVLFLAQLMCVCLGELLQLTDSATAFITRFDESFDDSGEYSYVIASSDGQERGETRKVLNPNTDQETVYVEGYFSYIAPDGEKKTVEYSADVNGFQAKGEHLPLGAGIRKVVGLNDHFN